MKPTRFPNGVNNVAQSANLGMYGALDPTRYHAYWNDFDHFVAADWTITKTEAGSGAAATALTNIDGGGLLLTNDNADDDNQFLQKVGTGFLLEAGKPTWFKVRAKLSDATNSDFQAGLIITDTTPLDATDGIYFLKSDDAATVDFYCRKDATTGSNRVQAIATLTDDTFVTLGWHYDGNACLTYFVNGSAKGSFDPTAYLPDALLTPSFGLQNGAAAIKTATIDYIFATKQRFIG